jgi:hypothetical protein
MSMEYRIGLVRDEYAADPAKATVRRLATSANEISLEVVATEATKVFVNERWAPEWRSIARTSTDGDSLRALEVPAGRHKLILTYRDCTLLACLMVGLEAQVAPI